MEKLLIVDDSVRFLNDVESLLKNEYEILKAASGRSGLEVLKKNNVTVVLLDMRLPDYDGIELVEKIHKDIDPLLPVIIVTDFGKIESAVEAMRKGAEDFVPKGFNINLLREKLSKALGRRRLEMKVRLLQSGYSGPTDEFIFASGVMRKLNLDITKIANQDHDVFLIGETGVGKDIVAREIHLRSKRRDKPYVQAQLHSMNEHLIESELFGHVKWAFTDAKEDKMGLFEFADGGTIYLPEVSTFSEKMQLKLLAFMEQKTVMKMGADPQKNPPLRLDVRLIMAATERNVEALLGSGKVRQDFFRRTGLKLEVPPLRERRDAIGPLAEYFIRKHTPPNSKFRYRLSQEVIEAFMEHEWPENVGELEESIKAAITFSDSDTLTLQDFRGCRFVRMSKGPHSGGPCEIRKRDRLIHEGSQTISRSYKDAESEFREEYFTMLLKGTGGDVTRAATISKMTVQGLRKTLKQLGIELKKTE